MSQKKKSQETWQEENEQIRRINNILKLCPVENLYCAQDLVLDLVEGRPVDLKKRKELKREGKTPEFQEKIYQSLIKRMDLSSNTGVKICYQFLCTGRQEYPKFMNQLKETEPDWEKIQKWHEKHPALNLLLGTCMGITDLFSSRMVEDYWNPDGTPFWRELECKVSKVIDERLAAAKAAGNLEEAIEGIDELEEHLYSLLLEPENLPVLESWYSAWIAVFCKIKYADDDKGSEELKKYFSDDHYKKTDAFERMGELWRLLNEWEFVMQAKDRDQTTWPFEKINADLDKIWEEAEKNMEEVRKSVQNLEQSKDQVIESLQAMAVEGKKYSDIADVILEGLTPLVVECGIREWVPDYEATAQKISEAEEYAIHLPHIMEKRNEYEQEGREFLRQILKYWLKIYPDSAKEIQNRLQWELKNYADQAGLTESLINEERTSSSKKSNKKPDTLLNDALNTLIDTQGIYVRKVRKEICPEAVEQIAVNMDDSLCFYLGWVNHYLQELIPELLRDHLQEVMEKYRDHK